MSFLAQLKIEDKVMNVLECFFEFSKATDHSGRPTQHLKGGQISILIESTQEIDFLEWCHSSEVKGGDIIFFKRDMMASAKRVEFNNAYCINYMEEFSAEGSVPMKTRIIISAEEITVNGTSFLNNWPTRS